MNILYIDIDSLRPDHIGVYGYEGPTTPNIDEFAADAVRFENAYVSNSPCMPSRAALHSGRYGISNGIATHGARSQVLNSPSAWDGFRNGGGNSRDWWTLPELFFENRIQTGAVSSFPRHPSPWFYHIWHEFYQPQEPTGESEYFQTPRAETVTDLATSFLERNGDSPFYLYTQFWDPHAPYNRTSEEVDLFRDVPLPPHPSETEITEHATHERWRSPTDPALEHSLRHSDSTSVTDRSALNELLAHYDAEIRYVDDYVGQLLEALKSAGLYDDTLIVLTADHGEEFGEQGVYREHWSVHDGTQRVPLLIKPPSGTDYDPGTRSQLVTTVDMAPTLADYADLQPPAGWQGQSLRRVLEDDPVEFRDYIVIEHGLYTAQRAVRTTRWKYIKTYNAGLYEDLAPEVQLYDMQADPWEQQNVAQEYPDVVSNLKDQLAIWVETHRMRTQDAPIETWGTDVVGRNKDPLREVAQHGPNGSLRNEQFPE